MLDMFAGPDRNKNIMLAVAVVAIAAIGILYAAGRLPGILLRRRKGPPQLAASSSVFKNTTGALTPRTRPTQLTPARFPPRRAVRWAARAESSPRGILRRGRGRQTKAPQGSGAKLGLSCCRHNWACRMRWQAHHLNAEPHCWLHTAQGTRTKKPRCGGAKSSRLRRACRPDTRCPPPW